MASHRAVVQTTQRRVGPRPDLKPADARRSHRLASSPHLMAARQPPLSRQVEDRFVSGLVSRARSRPALPSGLRCCLRAAPRGRETRAAAALKLRSITHAFLALALLAESRNFLAFLWQSARAAPPTSAGTTCNLLHRVAMHPRNVVVVSASWFRQVFVCGGRHNCDKHRVHRTSNELCRLTLGRKRQDSNFDIDTTGLLHEHAAATQVTHLSLIHI